MRKAAEHFVNRFPENPEIKAVWRFPTLDCGGDFLTDPANLRRGGGGVQEGRVRGIDQDGTISNSTFSPPTLELECPSVIHK